MTTKNISPVSDIVLYPILFNVVQYLSSVNEDAMEPNPKINKIFLGRLKNITQASTLQKKSIKRFVNETFYDGHERIVLNPYTSNKKAIVMFYAVYLIGIRKEEILDDKLLQKILKEGLTFSANGDFIVDDDTENKLKRIMMKNENYSEILEIGAAKVMNWKN